MKFPVEVMVDPRELHRQLEALEHTLKYTNRQQRLDHQLKNLVRFLHEIKDKTEESQRCHLQKHS